MEFVNAFEAAKHIQGGTLDRAIVERNIYGEWWLKLTGPAYVVYFRNNPKTLKPENLTLDKAAVVVQSVGLENMTVSFPRSRGGIYEADSNRAKPPPTRRKRGPGNQDN